MAASAILLAVLRFRAIATAATFGLMALAGCGENGDRQEPGKATAKGWLLGADSDEERFRLVERQFRGFDNTMWEVGERYESLRDAISRGNYDLALYQWDKINTAVKLGIERRPARAESAKRIFLTEWPAIRDELASRDPARGQAALEAAKRACQACHQAENVAYMNDQRLFEQLPVEDE